MDVFLNRAGFRGKLKPKMSRWRQNRQGKKKESQSVNVSQQADPAPAGDTRARVSSGFGGEKTACLITVLALLGILGGCAVNAGW